MNSGFFTPPAPPKEHGRNIVNEKETVEKHLLD